MHAAEDNNKFKVANFIACREQNHVNDLDDRTINMKNMQGWLRILILFDKNCLQLTNKSQENVKAQRNCYN